MEAMKLFWEHGFEGTSTDDLEAALKMGPSSILNSFGSKEQLYALAIETYMGERTKYFVDMLNSSPDTRQAFENLVNTAADEFTRSDYPTGCMISLAGTHMSAAYQSIRALLAARRALSERLLADRLRRGVSQGDLPVDTNVEELASFFGTVFRGMAVQARDGRSRAQLQAIGQLAMRAWPDAKQAFPKSLKSSRPPSIGRRRARRPVSD
jgi:AcrR family transcriptional regulator